MAGMTTETDPQILALQTAARAVLREGRPTVPPVIFFLEPLRQWVEDRHFDILKEAGFGEIRRAFNGVFIHLSADGDRLTDLAEKASMSKQAMGELVDDLIDLGFLVRLPDPTDRRAKLIFWGPKALEAHKVTLRAFAQIDTEIAQIIGEDGLADLRATLGRLTEGTRRG